MGTYPVVRRLTGRLERLQARVDALGAGDLSARVQVEGKDEVANLAQLVRAQRSVLASASHELRTPLTGIRMAIELLAGDNQPELLTKVAKDIAELDDLIDELLLSSRLESLDGLKDKKEVDLLALVAEEGARFQASVEGEDVQIEGDPRMLRGLVRNLLENAHRYGAGAPIEVSVHKVGECGAVMTVVDSGPGVPADERERIFEPFYRSRNTRDSGDGGVGLGCRSYDRSPITTAATRIANHTPAAGHASKCAFGQANKPIKIQCNAR